MNVLLAIDHSKCSDVALEELLKRDWPDGTHFHVMSIVEPFYPDYGDWYATYTPTLYEAEQEHVRQTCELVHQAAARISEKFGADKVTSECLEGFIKDEILAKARSWPADLIVLGSHDRRGLGKLLFGSVSQSIAAKAPCSVEIVRTEHQRGAA